MVNEGIRRPDRCKKTRTDCPFPKYMYIICGNIWKYISTQITLEIFGNKHVDLNLHTKSQMFVHAYRFVVEVCVHVYI